MTDSWKTPGNFTALLKKQTAALSDACCTETVDPTQYLWFTTLDNAYASIMSSQKKKEYIDYLKTSPANDHGFERLDSPIAQDISNLLVDGDGHNPHTTVSTAICMRYLQDVFEKGWADFVHLISAHYHPFTTPTPNDLCAHCFNEKSITEKDIIWYCSPREKDIRKGSKPRKLILTINICAECAT